MTTPLSTDPAFPKHRQPSIVSNGAARHAPGAALMTATGLEAVRGELARLRRRARLELEQRLREARSYGDGSNNDEYHAVREDQMVLVARIAALEGVIARTTLIDAGETEDGGAVIGATVTIEDLASGAITEYRLTSAHSLETNAISAASPIGQALIGAIPGATVTAELPNGRSRTIRLIDVKPTASSPA